MKLKKILVTTDFSDLSQQAYAPAASIARRFGAELHLVHVLESLPPLLFMSPEGVQTYSPEVDYHRKFSDLLARTAEDPAFQGIAVKPHLLDGGHVHDRLVHYQKHQAIDLTVIGTHGRTGLGHLFLGSFAERVVRRSASPVLVYRPPPGGETDREFAPRKILVPYDLSENAGTVLDLVRFLAEAYAPKVRFQHVLEPLPDLTVYALEGIAVRDFQERFDAAPSHAREDLKALARKELPTAVPLEVTADFGNPVVEIPREARESGADLIVMATHGRTGLERLLIGSVAEKVVQKAPCSVWTVRPAHLAAETR
jgi:nucleotide-binding universal stress UspA family protein